MNPDKIKSIHAEKRVLKVKKVYEVAKKVSGTWKIGVLENCCMMQL